MHLIVDLTPMRIPLVREGWQSKWGYSSHKTCIHGPVAELPTAINLDILGVPGIGMFFLGGGISSLPCVAYLSNNL